MQATAHATSPLLTYLPANPSIYLPPFCTIHPYGVGAECGPSALSMADASCIMAPCRFSEAALASPARIPDPNLAHNLAIQQKVCVVFASTETGSLLAEAAGLDQRPLTRREIVRLEDMLSIAAKGNLCRRVRRCMHGYPHAGNENDRCRRHHDHHHDHYQ